ncbi:hypothetical protein ACEPPN_012191 [Leptodophora sp. 'Broadleaf-Isolate-01']
MLSWFKRSFMSTWNMPCPQPPKVYMPPVVPDIPLPVPPDFSGVNPDDEPIIQGCEVLAAILDWFVKQIEEIGKFIYDWIKSIASMITYPLREEIYEHITLPMWEAGESIRMVLCHLGYIMPQSAQDCRVAIKPISQPSAELLSQLTDLYVTLQLNGLN